MAVEDFLNTQAEEIDLVGAILSSTNRHRLDQWLPELEGTDFTDPIDGEIWSIARQLHSAGKRVSTRSILTVKDTPVVHERLKRRAAQVSPPEDVPEKIRAVREVAAKRRLCSKMRSVIELAVTDVPYSEALEAAHVSLDDMTRDETDDTIYTMSTALEAWQAEMAKPAESARIIPTPWAELNTLLNGGIQPGRLYTVGARPGVGKSLSGANVAQHAAELGFSAAIFSLEMSTFEVTSRLVASGATAEIGRIMGRNLDDWARNKIDDYLPTATDLRLYISDKPGVTVEWIASQCRAIKRSKGLDLVVVDYLQLIRAADTRVPREQQVAQMSWALKMLARELEVAVILAAQINRQSVSENRAPEASDLRESGAIEQDSDGVWMLNPVVGPDKLPTGEIDLFVRKNRQGKQGSVRLAARTNYARFDDMAPYSY